MNTEYIRIFIKDQLVSFLISPWMIALPVALIIIYFLPPIHKYKIELVKREVSDKPDSFVRYVDLDKDGYGEKLILFNNQKEEAAIKVLNQSDVMLNWSDFRGTIYKDIPASGDFDHDGRPEIYFISNVDDSLYLNILSTTADHRYLTKRKFITPLNVKDRNSDYSIYNWQFCDLLLDGFDEGDV